MFEITVVVNNRELDLVLPRKVTLGKLSILLKETFYEQGYSLTNQIGLKLLGKTFYLSDEDLLSDFGVGNGDKIEILMGVENEII